MKKTAQGKEETHMTELLKLPVGIENFEEIRRDNFYYVDKTKLIEQLLSQWGKANLFTRPRRFGKSLNMSMLRSLNFSGDCIFRRSQHYVKNIWVSFL